VEYLNVSLLSSAPTLHLSCRGLFPSSLTVGSGRCQQPFAVQIRVVGACMWKCALVWHVYACNARYILDRTLGVSKCLSAPQLPVDDDDSNVQNDASNFTELLCVCVCMCPCVVLCV